MEVRASRDPMELWVIPESAILLWHSLDSPFFLLRCLWAQEGGRMDSMALGTGMGRLPDRHLRSSWKATKLLSSMGKDSRSVQ